jgi:hypothetical protein
MAMNLSVVLALVMLLGVQTPTQQFPPGFVDPAPLLAAAARKIRGRGARIAFEADLFNTHEPHTGPPTPAMTSFLNQIRRMKLDVTTIAPVHGRPVLYADFEKTMGAAANLCQTVGAGGSVAWAPCQ